MDAGLRDSASLKEVPEGAKGEDSAHRGNTRHVPELFCPVTSQFWQVSPSSAVTETPSERQEREGAFYEFIPSRNQSLLREKDTSPDGPQPLLEVRLEATVQALSLSLLRDRGCSHGLLLGHKDSRNPGTLAWPGNSSACLPARDLLLFPLGSGSPGVNFPRGGSIEETTVEAQIVNFFKQPCPGLQMALEGSRGQEKVSAQLSGSPYVTLCLLPGFLSKNLFLQIV